jgi:hypothetical protein
MWQTFVEKLFLWALAELVLPALPIGLTAWAAPVPPNVAYDVYAYILMGTSMI